MKRRRRWSSCTTRGTRRGSRVVGLAYEVSGDTAVDGALVRRYRDKFDIPFPLLLAGINDTDAAAATLPQLQGFTAFPTTIFIGRDGRVRQVHAGILRPGHGRAARSADRGVPARSGPAACRTGAITHPVAARGTIP